MSTSETSPTEHPGTSSTIIGSQTITRNINTGGGPYEDNSKPSVSVEHGGNYIGSQFVIHINDDEMIDNGKTPTCQTSVMRANIPDGPLPWHKPVAFEKTNPKNQIKEQKCIKTERPDMSAWTSLIMYYKSSEWLIPIPWRNNFRMTFEDHFVQICMDVLDRSGSIECSHSTTVDNLFDPIEEGTTPPNHILIRGDAGFGKSCFCSKLAYDWAFNKTVFPSMPSDSSLVLLYKLRNLKPESCLETELLMFASIHYSPSNTTLEEMGEVLKTYGEKLLVVLDGFDEVKMKHREQVKNLLNEPQSVFRRASKIVTSRPLTDHEFLFSFHKHLRMVGLSEDNATKLMSTFFKAANGSKAKELFETFKSSVFQQGKFILHGTENILVNFSPLFILMLCYAYSNESLKLSEKSFTDIIKSCIYLMAKRANVRSNFRLEENELEGKLVLLGKFFQKGLTENQLVFTVKETKDFLRDDFDFIMLCGFLRTIPPGLYNEEELLEPIHKMFMEKLVELYLEKSDLD